MRRARSAGSAESQPERLLARRRWIMLATSVAIPVALAVGFGHRGAHMVPNLVLPGSGVLGVNGALGVGFIVMALLSTVAWMQWGMDWSFVAVAVASVVVSGLLGFSGHPHVGPVSPNRLAHEFPLVIVAMSAVAWLKSLMSGLPLVRRWRQRRAKHLTGLDDLGRMKVGDRCRAGVIAALAMVDDPQTREAELTHLANSIDRSDVYRRARWIGAAARGRFTGDTLRTDHAHLRSALALCGRLDAAAVAAFRSDAARRVAGVPSSEPGWVRPLDATLAAVALRRLGDETAATRWAAMLNGHMSLRRRRRPAWYWTPIGLALGSAPTWEHATFTAIARSENWLGDDDWTALRKRVLGAAARGEADPADARLIAAGRLWLHYVDDPEAERIVMRRTISTDPLACAIDQLARRVQTGAPD